MIEKEAPKGSGIHSSEEEEEATAVGKEFFKPKRCDVHSSKSG